MPHTSRLSHMNPGILKFNWDFYVRCWWQEAYYSPSNTCRPPRSSWISLCTRYKRAAWFACIILRFCVERLIQRLLCLQEENIFIFRDTAGSKSRLQQRGERVSPPGLFLFLTKVQALPPLWGMTISCSLNTNKVKTINSIFEVLKAQSVKLKECFASGSIFSEG